MFSRFKDAMSARSDARTIVDWIFTAQAVALVVAAVGLWVRVFYLGHVDAAAVLSYRPDDTPPVPAVPWQLGVHMFGDFLLPLEQALAPNPWIDYTQSVVSYPPALMLVFKLFTFFPYRLALGLYLMIAAAGAALPVVAAVRRFPLNRAIVYVCVLVVLTLPFLALLDRANVQGLVLVPIYVFVVAWREQRWRRAAQALAVAIALKLYPLLLALGLLAERRFREAALAVGAAVAVTIVLLALYPHGIGATLQSFLASLAPFSTPNGWRFLVGNYSVAGMLANLTAVLFGPTSSQLSWFFQHPSVCGWVYLGGVVAVVFARDLPFVVRAACALSVLTFVAPLSYVYTLTFVFIVIGELLRDAGRVEDGTDRSMPTPLAIALAAAVVITLAPLPFTLPVTDVAVGTVLVPATWVAFVVTALVYGYRRGARPVAVDAVLRRISAALLPPPASP